MANNYLITGYWGEPHVTAENDRGIHAAMFGTGRFVFPVGEQFRAEYIGNNTIRMYDGKLMDNGAAAGIAAGEYVDLKIANAGQGMKRNDLIVFQYEQDSSTMIESGRFVVVQGAEVTGTASDPSLTQADLMTGKTTFDQMALWRVSVSGTTISAPVKVFSTRNMKPHTHSTSDIGGVLPIANGGTGRDTAPSMLVNLESSSAASPLGASPRPGVTGKLPVANGGTGASTAQGARANLGLKTENWTFTLEDGTTVTKAVYVG